MVPIRSPQVLGDCFLVKGRQCDVDAGQLQHTLVGTRLLHRQFQGRNKTFGPWALPRVAGFSACPETGDVQSGSSSPHKRSL